MKNQKAFSLLEVVIALGILASVLMVLTSSWTGNFRRVKKSELKTQAAYLLQQKMTELEVYYEGNVANLPTEKQSGEFEDFKGYRWEWEARDFELPDISQLFLSAEDGPVDELKLNILTKMKEYLQDSIKEVKLTLIYQPNTKVKPQRYSVSTLFVDYNVNLDVGI